MAKRKRESRKLTPEELDAMDREIDRALEGDGEIFFEGLDDKPLDPSRLKDLLGG